MRTARRIGWLVLAAFVLPLALASSAQAREFTGKVDKINKKKVIVDNRMGDKVTFERVKETEVTDESGGEKPKEDWKDVKKGDWVTVHWEMMDKPRKAYKVIVLPEKDEAGDDL